MSNVRDIDVLVNEGYLSDDDEQVVTSVNGMKGDVVITKKTLAIENIDNTSDLDKPVSKATQTALNAKANSTDLAYAVERISTAETNIENANTELSRFKTEVSNQLAGKLGTNDNAVSASKLNTPRKINGVDFDGSQDIVIQAEPTAHSHIVEMDSDTYIAVSERTSDKRYYNIKSTTSVSNGTATVSNMMLV